MMTTIFGLKIGIIPGMGGSRLFDHKGKRVWPPSISSFIGKDLEIRFDTHGNPLLPTLSRIGDISGIEIDTATTFVFTRTLYFSNLVRHFQKQKTEHELFALSYDFRFIFQESYRQQLYSQYIDFLEQQHEKSGEKIILVCHSMGGLILQHFLNSCVSESWYKQYIEKIYFVNVPFAGTPLSFYALMDRVMEPVKIRQEFLPAFLSKIQTLYHFGGFYLTLPLTTDPFMRKDGQWIHSHHLEHLFQDQPVMANNLHTLRTQFVPYRNSSIRIPHVFVYSYNVNTTTFIDYESHVRFKGNGDGVVPLSSLSAFGPMINEYSSIVTIPGVEHSRINSHVPFLNMISHNHNQLVF